MIYFAQASAGGPIKIGYSENVPQRIKQLARGLGKTVLVLGIHSQGWFSERWIHQHFAKVRIDACEMDRLIVCKHQQAGRSEWFRDTEDLYEFIDQNAEAWDAQRYRQLRREIFRARLNIKIASGVGLI